MRVVVTGAGVICPYGAGLARLREGIYQGRLAFSTAPIPLADRPYYGGHIPDFPLEPLIGSKGNRAMSRASRLLLAAAVMACREAALDPGRWEAASVGVAVGTTFAGVDDFVTFFREGISEGYERVNPAKGPQTGFNPPATQLSIRLGAQGANLTLTSGRLSSAQALSVAADHLCDATALVYLAGGIDTLSAASIAALPDPQPAPESATTPAPFGPQAGRPLAGEAAIILVLEDDRHAALRGAPVLGRMTGAGFGLAQDGSLGSLEAAVSRAVTEALESASASRDSIDAVFASAGGAEVPDQAEARAIRGLCGPHVPVYALKAAVGECFGAASALQVACALLSLAHGFIPATAGLSDTEPLPINLTRGRIERDIRRLLVLSVDPEGAAHALVVEK